ncbi:uncharacterized protein LOC141905978 [Tubulanus polymorphus]|uniref:uncharacterized protein LOC141905978 n=1 Tax=Tubulanus polymorphus TaxID=672921 RepID=UPI003DA44CA4
MGVPYGLVIGVPLLAVSIFLLMQPDHLTLKQSIFVQAEPRDVFTILRNPRILPKLARQVHTVLIEKETVDSQGISHLALSIREAVALLGNVTYLTNTVQDPKKLRTSSSSEPLLWGLIQFNSSWSFTSIVKQGYSGTIVTIDYSMNSPWAFIKLYEDKIAGNLKHMLKSCKKFGEVLSRKTL